MRGRSGVWKLQVGSQRYRTVKAFPLRGRRPEGPDEAASHGCSRKRRLNCFALFALSRAIFSIYNV